MKSRIRQGLSRTGQDESDLPFMTGQAEMRHCQDVYGRLDILYEDQHIYNVMQRPSVVYVEEGIESGMRQ